MNLFPEGETPAELMLLAGEPSTAEENAGSWMVGLSRIEVEQAMKQAGLALEGTFRLRAVGACEKANLKLVREAQPSVHEAILRAQPKLIVSLGATALKSLGVMSSVDRIRGDIRRFDLNGFRTHLLPTLSPGAVLREPLKRERLVRDFQMAAKFLKGELTGFTSATLEQLKLTTCRTLKDVREQLDRAANVDAISLDTETRGLTLFGPSRKPAFLVTIQIAVSDKEAFVIPVNYPKHGLASDKLRKMLQAFFRKYRGEVFVLNGKFDQRAIWSYLRLLPRITFDCMVAHAILMGDFSHNGLKSLAWKYCPGFGGYEKEIEDSMSVAGGDCRRIPLHTLAQYGGLDAVITFRVGQILREELTKYKKRAELNRMMARLSNILARAEVGGIRIDWAFLESYQQQLEEQREELKIDIRELCGREILLTEKDLEVEFNFASNKQVSHLLYSRLHLPVFLRTAKNKIGAVSKSALEELNHPVAEKFRQLIGVGQTLKLYIRAYPKLRHADDRVHPDFKLVRYADLTGESGTRSGRLSCTNPNVQQLTKDDKAEVRKLFLPDNDDSVLVDLDFSNLELRVAAMCCQDEKMKSFFNSGKDYHALTAAELFRVPLEDVKPEQRHIAKTINFAVLFGSGPERVAKTAKVDKYEAEQFITDYYDRFPALVAWRTRTEKYVRKHCYIESLFGRRRAFPEIAALVGKKGWQLSPDERETLFHVYRAAINHQTQSAGADLCFHAILQVDRLLREVGSKVRFLMTVHDSLVFSCPMVEVKSLVPKMLERIRNHGLDFITKCGVNIDIDAKVGISLGQLVSFQEALGAF